MLFRRSKSRREGIPVWSVSLTKRVAGRAEIQKDYAAIVQNSDIRRFQVKMQQPTRVDGVQGTEDRQGNIDGSLDVEMGLVLGVLVLEILLVGLATQKLHGEICRGIVLKYLSDANDARLFCKLLKNLCLMTKGAYGCVEIAPVLRIDADATIVEAFSNLPWKQFLDRDNLLVLIIPGAIADAEASMAFLAPQDVASANSGALRQKGHFVPWDAIEATERTSRVACPFSPQAVLT